MDTYYILDSAFECGELTPVEYAVLRSPVGAFSLIDHLVERDELEMSPDYLSNTARAFLERLPLAQRIFFGAQALEVAPMALRFLKQRASLFVQLKAAAHPRCGLFLGLMSWRRALVATVNLA